jgi:outer membrane protein assembly factor BamB
MKINPVKSILILAMMAALPLAAADWLTYGGDPQRTGWAKAETKIGKESVKKLELAWKTKTGNVNKELNSLTAPVIFENSYTPTGVKDVVVVAGASDNLYAIDSDNGKIIWSKNFQTEGQPKQQPNWLCPNALNATPVIQRSSFFLNPVYAIASDGKVHSLNLVNGEDTIPPTQFVPPFSKSWSLNLVDGVLYTTISQGCNGAKSGVYAMDLSMPNRPVTFFLSAPHGGGVWGRAGAAISNGKVWGETGDGPYDAGKQRLTDSVFSLAGKELKLADYYTPANREWITKKDLDMGNMSPAVFKFQKWELVAAAGKEGVIYLLDAAAPGGADHRTPLYRSALYANEDVDFAGRGFWGAFATWENPKGERWLYAPAWGPKHSRSVFPQSHGEAPNGSIMAFKVEAKEGKPVLTPAWISRDFNVPEPPVVANGVVLALSSGEYVRQVSPEGRLLTSKQRADASKAAVLYALDSETGKELWSSGDAIGGFTHFSGIAVAGGRVYVSAYDGTVYCFAIRE